MATQQQSVKSFELPVLPAKHEDWVSYASAHPDTPISDLIAPYKEYDSKLREIFAQQPDHAAIATPNITPLFTGKQSDVKIRARKMALESETERERYIMPLNKADRRADGSPAIVQSLKEFQTNFQLFSESSLIDMDWSNVVVAGSAVVTSLLPVPDEHNTSKRALREYYHQKLAPASDVDLFLYDLTEEEAVAKIKQIEQRIRDSILTETTTVRTKNAITIVSQYPTRHVQIVLRIYRSLSEILTGFDVDCSCAAYDGKQVYASPRAVAAYMTQINTIDLTRRSPSYENRLSKYSRRGFEVYWPLLDRSRIDPTLFERSFGRTLGLARLLVLEKLPKNTDREAYVDQRRRERGRPAINRFTTRKLYGNMKDEHDDEVAEWVETDEVSDYHTFTIPYGPKYQARKIERLLYAKDLLLNAEWNRPKDRETELHRHPAFFGFVEDVIGDCCGYCPKPLTIEDEQIAEEESKIYVSGSLIFIKDDPGRQAIGSFNPLTDDDWTEMAYVGNTARLCQAIVDGDLEHIQDWLGEEGADPNRRDYTGRTPLHLATISSTPEIVQCLVDAGARITARIFDGKTALHLAAMRGEVEMVKTILKKSESNEEKESKKEAIKLNLKSKKEPCIEDHDMADLEAGVESSQIVDDTSSSESDDGMDMLDDDSDNVDATTENSMVKIDRKKGQEHEALPEDDNEEEPDVLDVNVVAWDTPVTALHLAIANGYTEVVKVLVQDFGADVLLPIKLVNDFNKSARAAILPLVLTLQLPSGKAEEMTQLLMSLGASPAQADVEHLTALHYFAAHGIDLLQTMIHADRPAAVRAVNHLTMAGSQWSTNAFSALNTVVKRGDIDTTDALLELGIQPEVDFATYINSYKSKWDVHGNSEDNKKQFQQSFQQPIFTAVQYEQPAIVRKLLDAGVDINSMNPDGWRAAHDKNSYSNRAQSLLDAIRISIVNLEEFLTTKRADVYHMGEERYPPIPLKEDEAEYLQGYIPGSYGHWTVLQQLDDAKQSYEQKIKSHEEWKAAQKEPEGYAEKLAAVKALLAEFKALESYMESKEAKTFKELHPDVTIQEDNYNYNYRGWEPPCPQPFSPIVSFQQPDLTDERREAYVKLFQACWDADLPVIKELTLTVWNDTQSPLEIATKDTHGFSPYSIAVLRKHFDIARAILEIAHAQYAPAEKNGQPKRRVQPADNDDESADDDNDFYIYTEIVDDRFTVDNIGEVQNKVKSSITPLEMLSWPCPVSRFLEAEEPRDETSTNSFAQHNALYASRNTWSRRRSTGGRAPRKILKDAANNRIRQVQAYPTQEFIWAMEKPHTLMQMAIYLDDDELLHFLIAMGEDYTFRKPDSSGIPAKSTYFHFYDSDFQYAIRLGRVQLLEEIVKRTGAGIPLDDLVKKSGIEVAEKSEFYQGLSVHGKKRTDWANEGREMQCEPLQEQHPPLLHAARLSSLESVEWFSSEVSHRCYSEFAENNRDDERIQNLAKTKGGLDKSIYKWLQLRSHLLLHCVLLAKPTEQATQLLRHLCKTQPQLLEHKSASGFTPLYLACVLHRRDAIRVLIESGADQTCRDHKGNNILHAILKNVRAREAKENLPRYLEVIGLIDTRLLASLFLERSTQAPGAATPLASWLDANIKSDAGYDNGVSHGAEHIVQALLELSEGEDLSLVTGEGDTPVHAAVRFGATEVLRAMLECRPELLFRESATGRTPYEMAEDAFLSKDVFSDPPAIGDESQTVYGSRRFMLSNDNTSVLKKNERDFIGKPEDRRTIREKVWQLCREYAGRTENTKRKLVTLVEASEVAKRLALEHSSKYIDDEDDDGEEPAEVESEDSHDDVATGDEVDKWMNMALSA